MPVRIQRNRISCVLLWGCKIVPLWETIWQFLKEINSQLSYDRYINGILGHLSWGKQNMLTQKPMYACSKQHHLSQPKLEITDVVQQCYIYTVEYYSAIKSKQRLIHTATCMNVQPSISVKKASP